MPGKQMENYTAIKPTKRQQKKQARETQQAEETDKMINFLQAKWSNPVKFSCVHCLKEAYLSVVNQSNGYVTDDELIESSNNTLRHK